MESVSDDENDSDSGFSASPTSVRTKMLFRKLIEET